MGAEMKRDKASYDQAVEFAMRFPGVYEATSYGTPALRVGSKLIARLKEDGDSLVVRMSFEDRERLLREEPKAFYLTDHYLNYPAVLVRLSKVRPGLLSSVLEQAWRRMAPKRLVSAGSEGQGPLHPSKSGARRAKMRPRGPRGKGSKR
jgi:hypothetical protein